MSSDNTDEDWLMALAGKPRPEADRTAVQEAHAVRRAFKRIEASRKDKMEPRPDRSLGIQGQSAPAISEMNPPRSEGKSFGDGRFSRSGIVSMAQAQNDFLLRERAEYEQTRAALRRAGLLRGPASRSVNPASRSVKMWAIAASILTCAVVGVNVPYENDDSWDKKSIAQRVLHGAEPPLARGGRDSQSRGRIEGDYGGKITDSISESGEDNFVNVMEWLKQEGFRFETKKPRRGGLLLRVESSIAALQYLQGKGVDTRNAAGGWIYIESSSLPPRIQRID
jgi:hypothetical protein